MAYEKHSENQTDTKAPANSLAPVGGKTQYPQ